METAITVCTAGIPVDAEGRLSLNAIHQTHGGAPHKRPSKWLESKTAKDIAETTLAGAYPPILTKNGGSAPGTFAVKPIAIAYAMWLGGPTVAAKVMERVVEMDVLIEALNEFEVPEDLPDMYVYAIREKDTGHIKIGISKDPQARLQQMQVGNSSDLELVAYKKAENRFADEKAAHAAFDHYRIRGEWFSTSALEVM